MAEKRRPELVFVADWYGNNESTCKRKRLAKIELFPASLWADRVPAFGTGRGTGLTKNDTRSDSYRIRVNGKWWQPEGKNVFTLSDFFRIFRSSIAKARKARRAKARVEARKAAKAKPSV